MTMDMQQVVSRFGGLGVTIEMPFNDTSRAPHPVTGWGIEQSRRFGAATLQALYESLDEWL